jgi:hypothetical protein
MLYDSLEEYIEAIAEQKALISRIRKIGQEHRNDSGGSSRQTIEADLSKAMEMLSLLQKEKRMLDPAVRSAFRIGPAW